MLYLEIIYMYPANKINIYIYMIYQYQYRKKLFVILILILIRVFIIKNYFFYKNFLKKILNYISYWKYWFQKLIKSKTN